MTPSERAQSLSPSVLAYLKPVAMGAYLSAPVTEKVTENSGDGRVAWGASAMQGWRRTMEDEHVAVAGIGGRDDSCVFAVFDGHGGSEVSKYCKVHLLSVLEEDPMFMRGSPGEVSVALQAAFHRLDRNMRSPAAVGELMEYKWQAPDSASDDGESEASDMREQVADTIRGAQVDGFVSKEDVFGLMMRMLVLRKAQVSPAQCTCGPRSPTWEH
jgi:hypothetical protein